VSVAATRWARQQIAGGAGPKAVLLLLADYADADGGSCYPSQSRIAREAELDARTVRRHIDTLIARGLVAVHPVTTRTGRRNEYRLMMRASNDLAAADAGTMPSPPAGGMPSPPAAEHRPDAAAPAVRTGAGTKAGGSGHTARMGEGNTPSYPLLDPLVKEQPTRTPTPIPPPTGGVGGRAAGGALALDGMMTALRRTLTAHGVADAAVADAIARVVPALEGRGLFGELWRDLATGDPLPTARRLHLVEIATERWLEQATNDDSIDSAALTAASLAAAVRWQRARETRQLAPLAGGGT
jgi:hypothetical protein